MPPRSRQAVASNTSAPRARRPNRFEPIELPEDLPSEENDEEPSELHEDYEAEEQPEQDIDSNHSAERLSESPTIIIISSSPSPSEESSDPASTPDPSDNDLTMGLMGKVSMREYRIFDLQNDLFKWNLITPRPLNNNDQAWADWMPVFSYHMRITATSWPPAAVRLSDDLIGQLMFLNKCGKIAGKELGYRWPADFDRNGAPLRARRPIGLPSFIETDQGAMIAAVNDGTQLLCGADHFPTIEPGTKQSDWPWIKPKSGTGFLGASNEPAKELRHYKWYNQGCKTPMLNSVERDQCRLYGRLFSDDKESFTTIDPFEFKDPSTSEWRQAYADTFPIHRDRGESKQSLNWVDPKEPDTFVQVAAQEATRYDAVSYRRIINRLTDEQVDSFIRTCEMLFTHYPNNESIRRKTLYWDHLTYSQELEKLWRRSVGLAELPSQKLLKGDNLPMSHPSDNASGSGNPPIAGPGAAPSSSRQSSGQKSVATPTRMAFFEEGSAKEVVNQSAESPVHTQLIADLLNQNMQLEDASAKLHALGVVHATTSTDVLTACLTAVIQHMQREEVLSEDEMTTYKAFFRIMIERSRRWRDDYLSQSREAAMAYENGAYNPDATVAANSADPEFKWLPNGRLEELPKDLPALITCGSVLNSQPREDVLIAPPDVAVLDDWKKYLEGHLIQNDQTSIDRKIGNPNFRSVDSSVIDSEIGASPQAAAPKAAQAMAPKIAQLDPLHQRAPSNPFVFSHMSPANRPSMHKRHHSLDSPQTFLSRDLFNLHRNSLVRQSPAHATERDTPPPPKRPKVSGLPAKGRMNPTFPAND